MSYSRALPGVLPETVLKWFAVITSLASVIGNFTAPQLIEMLHLQHRLKSVLGITLCLQLVAYALFAVLLPDSPLPLMKGSTGPLVSSLWLKRPTVSEALERPKFVFVCVKNVSRHYCIPLCRLSSQSCFRASEVADGMRGAG